MGHYASEMGDGGRGERAAEQKHRQQRRRIDLLQQIMTGPGFGESDGNNSDLEGEAAEHLRKAYQLLCLFDRGR